MTNNPSSDTKPSSTPTDKKGPGRPKTNKEAFVEREYIRPAKRIPATRQDKTRFPDGIEQLPDKRYCWVLEQDIQDKINAWYEFVKDKNGTRVRMVANKSVDMTALNRMQYLMMVDESHYLEDFALQQDKCIDLKRKKETLGAGQYRPRSL